MLATVRETVDALCGSGASPPGSCRDGRCFGVLVDDDFLHVEDFPVGGLEVHGGEVVQEHVQIFVIEEIEDANFLLVLVHVMLSVVVHVMSSSSGPVFQFATSVDLFCDASVTSEVPLYDFSLAP